MYALYLIQEFKGKKVGVYRPSESHKQIRKAEREILKKGNPDYAIFILDKLKHGIYNLYENSGSYVKKESIDDNTYLALTIHI